MDPVTKKPERRFRCPVCRQPILSRKGACSNCKSKFNSNTIFACPICGSLLKQADQVCPGCTSKLVDWGVSFEDAGKGPVEKPVKNWEEISKDFASRLQKIEKELSIGDGKTKPEESKEVVPLPPPPPPPTEEPIQPADVQKEKVVQKKASAPPYEPPTPPPMKPVPEKPVTFEARQAYVRQDRPGRVNGTKQGRVNGTKQGRVNGTKQGRVNGTKQGRVNGTSRGNVNGLKKQFVVEEEELEPSRMRTKVGGIIPLWQLLSVIIVAILMVSTAVIIVSNPSEEGGIKIDGYFTDWASVPAYQFSQVSTGWVNGVDEGRISFRQEPSSISKLFMYMKLKDSMFSGPDVSSVYIFIDSDADAKTGYQVSKTLGADRMIVLSGWNGSIEEKSVESYDSTQDRTNWSSWEWYSGLRLAKVQAEIEISLDVLLAVPLVQIATHVGNVEAIGPIMSPDGTIVIKGTPLQNGAVITDFSPSLFRVKAIAMGLPDQVLTFEPVILNETGHEFPRANLTISTTDWTSQDYDLAMPSQYNGHAFHYTLSGSSTGFEGAIDISGEPSCGYYMSAPSFITIDGLFSDWNAIKQSDNDSSAMENPNIDIKEYGVATQNNSLFTYVGTVGKTFNGADVPEHKKRSSGGGGGGSVVRLRRTGEDLLQAFIDKDPASGIGKVVTADGKSIEADYLVEIYGKNGIVTSDSVKRWSVANSEWQTWGSISDIGVGKNGVEFSVNKSVVGDLSSCEFLFFTTDWKAESDNCWTNASLADPWAVRGTLTSAGSYRSGDGITWTSVGSISLASGESIVALAHSLDRNYVFAVTNTGRVYDWHVGVDTSWGPEVTGPCNSTNVVGIAPNTVSGEGGCVLLGSNGWRWLKTSIAGPRGWTNGTGKIGANGLYDFKDISYNATGGTYWVIRSTLNTALYHSSTPKDPAWNITAKKTGSAATQVHVYHIGSSGGASTDQVFVLCQDGSIRYSATPTAGGNPWGNRGNLPAPGTGRYVAIDRDASNAFWAITNTSYCYKSTDVGVTWTYTGNSIGANDVSSLACPIPEFDSMIIPIAGVMFIGIFVSISKNRHRRSGKDHGSNDD